jgi:hypothetical protein
MDLDILSALEATPSASSGRRCIIGKWLQNIPEGTPGLNDLAATIVTKDKTSSDYRTLTEVTIVLSRLGLSTTATTVGDHRAGRCVCHA